jgi:drug/metabolite transporter (DMT)-like permease
VSTAKQQQQQQQQQLAQTLIFITPALWAVNYLIARWAPGEIAPHMLALCRWALAAVLLGAFAWAELRTQVSAIRQEWWQFLVLGALGMWVCGAWVYMGARTTSAINIGLIYAASPVLITVLSWLWLKERFSVLQGAGVLIALAGLVHIIVKGQWTQLGGIEFVAGDFFIVAAALAWAIYALLLKRWPSQFSPMARLALTAAGGCVVMVIPTAAEAVWVWDTRWGWKSAALIITSAIVPGAAAYFAYSFAQKHLGPARVATALYLGPLYAALFGGLILGEALHGFHAVGAALILPGIWLASRPVGVKIGR